MRTILAFVGGGDRDHVILQTALAAARPLSAHLDVLHVHVPATEAARYSHTEFASGAALRNALDRLKTDSKTFADRAAENVRQFCASAQIDMCDTPTTAGNVSASFREETSNELQRLTFHARHADLIVMGRARQTQGLAPDTLEHLVLNCGRPILVAATAAPQTLTHTVVVCWKESSCSARALTAATPILAKARRVVFVSVAESDAGVADALHDLARQFARNGVSADVQVVSASGRRIAAALSAAADDCGADLVVMGAYSRSRARELIFGSCTDAFIDHSDKPILLMH
jgi:nucleotide-binding universal stress UspA family protein